MFMRLPVMLNHGKYILVKYFGFRLGENRAKLLSIGIVVCRIWKENLYL